jgi:branched-chain amino acid transport system permease protein
MEMAMQNRRKERLDRSIKIRTDGVYAINSWREISYLVGPRLLLILGLLSLPLILSPFPYWQRVVSIMCIYALLAISFDFLAHFVGLVSLGGALYIGTGAYIAALLNTEFGMSPFLTIPIATFLGGAIITLLLWPCLPLRGVYFAIVSLMFPLLAARVIEALDIFGGTDGILGVDGLPNNWVEMYLLVVVLLLVMFGLRRLVNEDVGLVFRGVKDNDQAVKASGINITTFKALGVFIAACMGCLGGAALSAHLHVGGHQPVRPGFFHHPHRGHGHGRSGTLVGPVLGCLILVPISELLGTSAPCASSSTR